MEQAKAVDTTEFKVSVIIPVYNTERYLDKTLASVVNIEEVGEVILVDDGSSDGSLELCKKWSQSKDKVKMYQHEGGFNKGRGASRNLGIKKATFPYIAFLDSDDIYLPNRFHKTKKVFTTHEDIDGVYEAIGIFFESDEDKLAWEQRFKFNLTTVSKPLKGNALFKSFLWGTHGHFSGNAVTLRKSAFEKAGYYPSFAIAEDTHLFLRMTLKCHLLPGNIENETGRRRIHGDNSVLENRKRVAKHHVEMYKDLLKWCSKENMGFGVKLNVRMRLYLQYYKLWKA